MLDSFGSNVLDRTECLMLIGTATFGRVVFTRHGLPAVQPVRFVLAEEAVWFRVAARTELYGAAQNGVVAFEVDLFDEESQSGWWVTVLGRATEGEFPGQPSSRPPAADERCVKVPIEVVSGGRVSH
jgi:uncharacterized protein